MADTTWAAVKRAIAARLNRPNLDPAVIQMFAEERADVMAADGFWPSQQTDTELTTEPGQYFYLLPRGITNILMVRLQLNSIWIPLAWARSYEDILIADPVQPPFTAIPSSGRVFGRLLRLFPTPNDQYPLELTVERRVDIPSDDTDTQSFWCNEGRALIINRTCEHIAQELLRDPDRAAMHKSVGDEARDAMDEITHSRNGPTVMSRYL
jgi:hypothetical protein